MRQEIDCIEATLDIHFHHSTPHAHPPSSLNHSHQPASMHFFKLLALTALSWTAVTAKKAASSSKFDTYLGKQASSAPFELDEKGYNDLTAAPRDYSIAVLLTARDAKYACKICRDFDAEWKIIGNSWQKADRKGEHRVLFSTIDFDNGRNVFMKVSNWNVLGVFSPGILTLIFKATTPNCTRPTLLPSNSRRERKARRSTYPL
jgi:hypothetical protein